MQWRQFVFAIKAVRFCNDSGSFWTFAIARFGTLLASNSSLKTSCRPEARSVARKIVRLGLGLGIATGVLLTGSAGLLPKFFTSEKAVLSAVTVVFPW